MSFSFFTADWEVRALILVFTYDTLEARRLIADHATGTNPLCRRTGVPDASFRAAGWRLCAQRSGAHSIKSEVKIVVSLRKLREAWRSRCR